MIVFRNYRFQLEPTPEQGILQRQFAGCRRWVWNKALEIQLTRLEEKQPLLSYGQTAKLLTEWRHDEKTAFLSEGPVHTQQQALRDLDIAFQRWRANIAGLPRFKKRGIRDSMRYPDASQIHFQLETKDPDGREILPKIFLPKLGWVKFRMSRAIPGEICRATISYKAGHWHVSIQVKIEITPNAIPQTVENTIAGDIGITQFLTFSDGTSIDKPVHIEKHQRTLAKAQQKLSRKKRGSKNYNEQKMKVQKSHYKVSCARKDFLDKASTQISKNHAYVKLEDANVKNMIRTKESDQHEEISYTAKQRARFNKKFLDIGWGMFLNMLDYKLQAKGGAVLFVDPAYTSQECSECHHICKENRPSRAVFSCVSCNHRENADFNASKVILSRAGHARVACAEPISR